MRFFSSLLAIGIMSITGVLAQEGATGDIPKCSTNKMLDQLHQEHPEILAESLKLDSLFEKRMASIDPSSFPKDGEPYVIPVVFHVIHDGGDENISVAQIENAIDVMNQDFSANSIGINLVNPAFASIVADVGIEFRLARRDPDGNCTNGIVRVQSELTYEGGENLKTVSPIWDRSKYMNVWVCRTIASGAAGYTYYPATLAGDFGETNDGIVVRSDYVGATGTSNYGRSQTMSHEVGHWINLAHLWGSTNQPELPENCDVDDGVEDTPNTIGWTTCNLNGESCGSLDNVENFMEYSFCGKMFTEGQKIRMIASLTSSVAERNNLWTEENLVETGVFEEPVLCEAGFSADRKTICVNEVVSFADESFSNVASRTWVFEGGTPASSSLSQPEVTYTEPGLYTVSILAEDGNGNQVTEVKNDFILVLDTAHLSTPFFEGFESALELNSLDSEPFYTENESGGVDFQVTDLAAYSGERSLLLQNQMNLGGEDERILSKTIDLTSPVEDPVLTFKYACAPKGSNSDDVLQVWISSNCGKSWSLHKTLDGDDLYTAPAVPTGDFIPSSSSQWAEAQVTTIIGFFQTSNFRFKFEFISGGGNNLFIDDINIVDETTLSTEKEIGYKNFKLFPNPASNEVQIQFERISGHVGTERIEIYDLSGRRVYEEILRKGETSVAISIHHLESGAYIVSLGNGVHRKNEKLIIQR